MKFHWQTEEEGDWEQPGHEPARPGLASRRRGLWMLFSLALVAVGVFFGWRQLRDTVQEASDAVKEDVLSSDALARRAAAQRDEELFVSILSGRNRRWTGAQKERLLDGLLFEETLRPLGFLPLAGPAEEVEVTLNPELSEAVVQTVRPFSVDAGGGVTATVQLTQTHVYRQGSRRWLLSPPDAAFWGSWQTVDGELLTVVAPARDQELVARLALDLDAKLGEMCRESVACPHGFHVRLRLEKDPSSVNQTEEVARKLDAGQILALPAPTLLGLPADEDGYEALLRAYARHLAAAAMTSLTEYECCDGILFYRALMQMQLAALDLRSPPLTRGEYRHLLDVPTSARHLVSLWEREELPAEGQPIPPEIYSLIHFLQQRSGAPGPALRELQDTFGASFWTWLQGDDWGLPRAMFEEQWKTFVQDTVNEGQTTSSWPQDLALPGQDIVALCGDDLQDVYRYDLREERWSKEMEAGFELGLIGTLPEYDGYIITGQLPAPGEEQRLTTILVRNGAEPLTLAGEDRAGPVLVAWGIVEPGRHRMVVWLLSGPGEGPSDFQVALLDPDSCGPQGCAFEDLMGMPVWSPDGSRKVVVDIFDRFTVYYEREGAVPGEELSAGAVWPFWLDNETFGFVGGVPALRRQEVRIIDVTTGELSVLLTGQDALTAIPEDRRPPALGFTALLRHPTDQNAIVALVTGQDIQGDSFLLDVRRTDEQAAWIDVEPDVHLWEVIEGTAQEEWLGIGSSNKGRWLTLPVQRAEQEGPGLVIYDLQEGRVVLDLAAPFAGEVFGQPGDWSADSVWFAGNRSQRIDLIAPGVTVDGRPARHAIFHDFRRCTSIGWVNR